MTEIDQAPPPDRTRYRDELFDAFLTLRSRGEVEAFLSDLCTPSEIRSFVERWQVAALLDGDRLTYREIADEAGASTTTVTRVARFLREMPFRGYRLAFDRLREQRR